MRKKVSTDENNLSQIDLDDDESIVVENTTTKRIRRERKPAPVEIEPEPDDFIDAEIDDADENEPPYADDSLAAIIFAEESSDPNIDEEYCSIAIRRNPDEIHDTFVKPCMSVTNLPRLSDVSIATRKPDIEERIRKLYGGGRYFFQMHYNGRLRKSWKTVLADDPAALAPAPAAEPIPVQPPENPIQNFINVLQQQRQLKELLSGDEEKRLAEKIHDLERQLAEAKSNPAPQSEKLAIIETALKVENDDLQRRLLDRVFPAEPTGDRSAIADILDVVLNNSDKIMPLVQNVLGSFMPQQPTAPAPAAASSIDAFLSQPPPAAEHLPIPATTWRRNPESEPAAEIVEPADAEPAADTTEPEAADTTGEIVESEVSDAVTN